MSKLVKKGARKAKTEDIKSVHNVKINIFFTPILSSILPNKNEPKQADILSTTPKISISLKLNFNEPAAYIPPKAKIVIKASL